MMSQQPPPDRVLRAGERITISLKSAMMAELLKIWGARRKKT